MGAKVIKGTLFLGLLLCLYLWVRNPYFDSPPSQALFNFDGTYFVNPPPAESPVGRGRFLAALSQYLPRVFPKLQDIPSYGEWVNRSLRGEPYPQMTGRAAEDTLATPAPPDTQATPDVSHTPDTSDDPELAAQERASPWGYTPTKPEKFVQGGDMRLTYVGHGTVLIQTMGLNILIDPLWSDYVGPFASWLLVNRPFAKWPLRDMPLKH